MSGSVGRGRVGRDWRVSAGRAVQKRFEKEVGVPETAAAAEVSGTPGSG